MRALVKGLKADNPPRLRQSVLINRPCEHRAVTRGHLCKWTFPAHCRQVARSYIFALTLSLTLTALLHVMLLYTISKLASAAGLACITVFSHLQRHLLALERFLRVCPGIYRAVCDCAQAMSKRDQSCDSLSLCHVKGSPMFCPLGQRQTSPSAKLAIL